MISKPYLFLCNKTYMTRTFTLSLCKDLDDQESIGKEVLEIVEDEDDELDIVDLTLKKSKGELSISPIPAKFNKNHPESEEKSQLSIET